MNLARIYFAFLFIIIIIILRMLFPSHIPCISHNFIWKFCFLTPYTQTCVCVCVLVKCIKKNIQHALKTLDIGGLVYIEIQRARCWNK